MRHFLKNFGRKNTQKIHPNEITVHIRTDKQCDHFHIDHIMYRSPSFIGNTQDKMFNQS